MLMPKWVAPKVVSAQRLDDNVCKVRSRNRPRNAEAQWKGRRFLDSTHSILMVGQLLSSGSCELRHSHSNAPVPRLLPGKLDRVG